jgi:hypothetical protein
LELRQKFSTLTCEVLTPTRSEAIEHAIDSLGDLEDIRYLTALLAKESQPPVVSSST